MPSLVDLVRRRTPDCESVAEVLTVMAAGEDSSDHRAVEHVLTCLRCQAEVARYRRILRTLHTLQWESRAPMPGTLASILGALEASTVALELRHGRVRRTAYVGGVAAAAAGAAGVLVWVAVASRRRAA